MKSSDRLNILSQMINLTLFLYLSLTAIIQGAFNLVQLSILGYGLLSGLVISIISQVEKMREESGDKYGYKADRKSASNHF